MMSPQMVRLDEHLQRLRLPTAPTGTRLIVVINQGWGIFDDRRWGNFE